MKWRADYRNLTLAPRLHSIALFFFTVKINSTPRFLYKLATKAGVEAWE
jgi:hypothetical protein